VVCEGNLSPIKTHPKSVAIGHRAELEFEQGLFPGKSKTEKSMVVTELRQDVLAGNISRHTFGPNIDLRDTILATNSKLWFKRV